MIIKVVAALIEKDNNISKKRLLSSGRELGYDIMGTMINVLLFTYICGEIPLIILKMKNGFNLINLISLHIRKQLCHSHTNPQGFSND